MKPSARLSLREIDRQLTQIACRRVIHQAASMLVAKPLINPDGYMFMGMERFLYRPDETTPATLDEIRAYERHRCSVDKGIKSDDLTLMDCIHWILSGPSDEGCEEDQVSFEEVLEVMGWSGAELIRSDQAQ
jgi:hypothetical protein